MKISGFLGECYKITVVTSPSGAGPRKGVWVRSLYLHQPEIRAANTLPINGNVFLCLFSEKSFPSMNHKKILGRGTSRPSIFVQNSLTAESRHFCFAKNRNFGHVLRLQYVDII